MGLERGWGLGSSSPEYQSKPTAPWLEEPREESTQDEGPCSSRCPCPQREPHSPQRPPFPDRSPGALVLNTAQETRLPGPNPTWAAQEQALPDGAWLPPAPAPGVTELSEQIAHLG